VESKENIDDADARFDALVRDAKRDVTARKSYGSDYDEPYDPIRALVVNSLCFLLPGLLFFILAAPLLNGGIVACSLAILLPAAICIKIISSETLARWVINGAIFFLIGLVGLVLLIILGLPAAFTAAATAS
jgi:hypothetical protein